MSERIVKGSAMATLPDDLSIDELLADSLVGAVMRADRVDPIALGAQLRSVARRMEPGAERPAFVANSRPHESAGLSALVLHRPSAESRRLDSLVVPPHIGEALAAGARGALCGSGVCW
jgi:hypothetical protein